MPFVMVKPKDKIGGSLSNEVEIYNLTEVRFELLIFSKSSSKSPRYIKAEWNASEISA